MHLPLARGRLIETSAITTLNPFVESSSRPATTESVSQKLRMRPALYHGQRPLNQHEMDCSFSLESVSAGGLPGWSRQLTDTGVEGGFWTPAGGRLRLYPSSNTTDRCQALQEIRNNVDGADAEARAEGNHSQFKTESEICSPGAAKQVRGRCFHGILTFIILEGS